MANKEFDEEKIEDFLYENPWLINPPHEIAGIKGEKGNGRQVKVEYDVASERHIDLLLKDTLSRRPVIVELKNVTLERKHIGQILEYRALSLALSDEKKNEFEQEFGNNYFVPKLVLIGENCPEEIRLGANLAGIEVKELKRKDISSIDIKEAIREFQNYRDSIEREGNSLRGRIEKIKKRVEILCAVCKEVNLKAYGSIVSMSGTWGKSVFPFMDFGVKTTEDPVKDICGFYEFYLDSEDEKYDLPYDHDNFYGDIWFGDIQKEIKNNFSEAKKIVKEKLKNNKIELLDSEFKEVCFVTKIPRRYLKNEKELKTIFKKYIELSLGLRKKYEEKT